jgi:hypothetical protein
MHPTVMAIALTILAATLEVPNRAGPISKCAPSLTGRWEIVRNHQRALAFIEDARRSAELAEGAPFDCGLTIATMCGDDLNGDGLPEILVRARWEDRFAENDSDTTPTATRDRCHRQTYKGGSAPYSALYLVASTKNSPGGKVILISDETGSGREGPDKARFIAWKGRPAIRLVLHFMHSDTGITDRIERIISLKGDAAVTLTEAALTPTY